VKSPGRIICPGCKQDIPTSGFDEAAKVWLYPCPECAGVDGPLTLEVAGEGTTRGARGGSGILAELGVYDGSSTEEPTLHRGARPVGGAAMKPRVGDSPRLQAGHPRLGVRRGEIGGLYMNPMHLMLARRAR
jgi:hypothetical protein